MGFVKGIDISYSTASRLWLDARFAEGNRVFVVDLWTGGYQNNPSIRAVAEANLRTAREAGYVCAGYANAAPPDWWPDEQAVSNAEFNAGAEWERIDVIVIDIEIDGVTWPRVFSLAQAFEAEGKRVCVYTGKWVIDKMGQPPSMPYKLWTTGTRAYAPWTEADVIGHQLGETATDGVTYDYDDFDAEYFTPAQPQQEDDMAQPLLVRFPPMNGIYLVDGNELKHLRNAETAAEAGYDISKTQDIAETDARYNTLSALPISFVDLEAAKGAFNR